RHRRCVPLQLRTVALDLGIDEGFELAAFVRAGLVVDDPPRPLLVDEGALEADLLESRPRAKREPKLRLRIEAFSENPAAVRVLENTRERASDPFGRLPGIPLIEPEQRELPLESGNMFPDALHIPACKPAARHALQITVDQRS